MEKFLVLKTFTDQTAANDACASMEDAGIPVMLEHVVIESDGGSASGYRILAPAQFTQSAQAVLSKLDFTTQTRLRANQRLHA